MNTRRVAPHRITLQAGPVADPGEVAAFVAAVAFAASLMRAARMRSRRRSPSGIG